jgi:hypothetical protein
MLARALGWAVLVLLAGCRGFGLVGVVERETPEFFDAGQPGEGSVDAALSDAGVLPDAAASGTTPIDECGPDNPAGLSAAEIATLRSGANSEPTQRYLYPYEGTVFPGGLSAPLVMWAGPSSDAVLLHLHNRAFDYTGCLKPSAAGRVAIPQHVWSAAEAAGAGPSDQIEMQLTSLGNGRASGPIARSFVIAAAPFKSSIYYMSYGPTGTAGITRLRPGLSAQPVFAAVGCTGCHALSANGTRMLGNWQGSGSSARLGSTTSEPETLRTQLPGAEFAALYPDGSLYVAPGRPSGIGPRNYSVPQLNATLFDVASGQAFPGAGIPAGATVPAFSASGALLAFNDAAIDAGHGLAVMDFDASARLASHYRSVYRAESAYPAWPNFLPDGKRVLFALGQSADFSALGARLGSRTTPGPNSDLYSVSSSGGDAALLARAAGYSALGDPDTATYLPFGPAELHQSYYPSVCAVMSGGYAWLFFDSIRNYGNQGVLRQLWGAAIDVSADGTLSGDPSHPAFYLPGQDITATNMRAVCAVEPCGIDNRTCTPGDACCTAAAGP